MAKSPVTITAGTIYLNGVAVGQMEGRREIYVTFFDADGTRRPVARFKYMRPGVNCRAWINFILLHYTPQQLIDILYYRKEGNKSPLGLAEEKGYVSPNKKAAEKAAAEAARIRTVTIVTL